MRQIRRASEADVCRSGDDVGEQMFVGHIGMGLGLILKTVVDLVCPNCAHEES